MARIRTESAPEFKVYDESVSIKAATGATSNLLEIKNASDSVLLSVTNTGVLTGNGSGLVSVFPTGMVSPYAGSSAPSGWLLADGSAVSRTTYAALFAVVGTTYGAGDTTTTFNLPDLRGRVVMGAGTGVGDAASGTGKPAGTQLTERTLGQWFGSQNHTIASANLPVHTHTTAHTHGVSISAGTGVLTTAGPSNNTTTGVSTASTGGPSDNTSGTPSDNTTGFVSSDHSHGFDHWHNIRNTSFSNPFHWHQAWFITDAQSGTNRARVTSAGSSLGNYGIVTSEGSNHEHTVGSAFSVQETHGWSSTGGISANHEHSLESHTHTMKDHTHTMAHTHEMQSHTHGFDHGHTGSTSSQSTSTSGDGGFANSAISNINPTVVLNYIIKT